MEDDIHKDATPAENEQQSAAPDTPEVVEPVSAREAIERAFDKVAAAEADTPETPDKAAPAVDAPAQPNQPAKQPTKAPQSWKPAVRERFASLSQDVQQEILRREFEINDTLAKTTQERRVAQDFIKAITPYQDFFKSQGIHPMAATQTMLNVSKVLHTGTMAERATVLANMVRHHKIDFKELDAAFEKVFSGQQAPAIDPQLDQRLRAIEQATIAQQREKQQVAQNHINNHIQEFAKNPKNEFFNDVVGHMSALLQSGQAPDLQTAYDQACWANPGVRKVLLERQSNNKARQNASGATLTNNGPRNATGNSPVKGRTTREILDALVPKDFF